MDVEPLDVEDLESEEAEVVDEGFHCVLRDVLVVDAVELVLLDELECMRNLDDEHAVVVEQERHTQRERVEIADVMERVGRDDDLRRAVFLADLTGQLGREVLGDDLEALLARKLGDVPRRVDPEGPGARCVEEREEEPVIAADVDRERIRRAEEPFLEAARQAGEVPVHRLGSRRDVDVVAEILGRNLIGDLDQPAVEADVNVKREEGFRLAELLLAEKAVRKRVVAQREEEVETVALAGPTGCHRNSSSFRCSYAAGR